MTMKLKYYLRGLGTGIVVTALVLGISLSHGKENISDEEVKKRAAELGMVEEFKSLEEASREKDMNETEAGEMKVSGNEAEGNKASAEGQKADDKTSDGSGTAADKKADENQPADNKTPEDSQDAAKAEQEQAKADESKENEKEDSGQDSGNGGFGSSIEKEEDSVTGGTEAENSKPAGKSIVLEVHSGDGSLSVAKRAEKAGLVADAEEFDRFLCSGGYDKKICTGKHEIPEGATMEEIAKLLIRKP